MKNHIHTIPVLDALREAKENGGCPFCIMKAKLEYDAVAFIMGPAYMEDDVRMETNRVGFCAGHLQKMYAGQNRLGLALMLHTHIKKLNGDLDAASGKNFKKLQSELNKAADSCYVCRKIEETFAMYVETYFHLWKSGGDEASLIETSCGFCVPHFALLLNESARLGKAGAIRFTERILPSQSEGMLRTEEDLEWFILKFDYRNINEPWKNSKDALPRAIKLLGGCDVEREAANAND